MQTSRSSSLSPLGAVAAVAAGLVLVAGCAGLFGWLTDDAASSPQTPRQNTSPRAAVVVDGPARFLKAMQEYGFEIDEAWHLTPGEPEWWMGAARQSLSAATDDPKPHSQLLLTIHSSTGDHIRSAMLQGIVLATEDEAEVRAAVAKAAPAMLEKLGVTPPVALVEAIEVGTPMTSETPSGTVSLEIQSDPTAFVVSIKNLK